MKSEGKKYKAFLLKNLQSLTKIMLFTKLNKVDNLPHHYMFYWDCLICQILLGLFNVS